MTEYVILHPVDDTFVLVPADVREPVLMPKDGAERRIRRMALERELALMDAEEDPSPRLAIDKPGWAPPQSTHTIEDRGPMRVSDDEATRRYAGSFTGADGVRRTELHHTEQRPGPQYVCECSQAFYDPAAFKRHGASCGVHRRFTADPRYEPGAFVNGSNEPQALR